MLNFEEWQIKEEQLLKQLKEEQERFKKEVEQGKLEKDIELFKTKNFNESILVKTQANKDFLKAIIPKSIPSNKIQLLYRGTRDGWNISDFSG